MPRQHHQNAHHGIIATYHTLPYRQQLATRHAPFKRVYAICHSFLRVACKLHGGYAVVYRVGLSNQYPPIHFRVSRSRHTLVSTCYFFFYSEHSLTVGVSMGGVDVITANTVNAQRTSIELPRNLQRTSTELAETWQLLGHLGLRTGRNWCKLVGIGGGWMFRAWFSPTQQHSTNKGASIKWHTSLTTNN